MYIIFLQYQNFLRCNFCGFLHYLSIWMNSVTSTSAISGAVLHSQKCWTHQKNPTDIAKGIIKLLIPSAFRFTSLYTEFPPSCCIFCYTFHYASYRHLPARKTWLHATIPFTAVKNNNLTNVKDINAQKLNPRPTPKTDSERQQIPLLFHYGIFW